MWGRSAATTAAASRWPRGQHSSWCASCNALAATATSGSLCMVGLVLSCPAVTTGPPHATEPTVGQIADPAEDRPYRRCDGSRVRAVTDLRGRRRSPGTLRRIWSQGSRSPPLHPRLCRGHIDVEPVVGGHHTGESLGQL